MCDKMFILFFVCSTLLDTLLSLQPQRSVAQGDSKEDKVFNVLLYSIVQFKRHDDY